MRGESIILRDERGYDWYEYSIPGNVHFGFVGRAAGFSGFELHGGAGYAEITDPAHDEGSYCCPNYCKGPNPPEICEEIDCYYVRFDWIGSLFDDPADWWNVEFGIRLYETYHESMTLAQFESFLATNGHWLTKATIIPKPWRPAAGDWPYTLGRFDGPDTAKNQPELHELIGGGP